VGLEKREKRRRRGQKLKGGEGGHRIGEVEKHRVSKLLDKKGVGNGGLGEGEAGIKKTEV